MAEGSPFLRTSGRFTANFASFPSYFRQVHRYFLWRIWLCWTAFRPPTTFPSYFRQVHRYLFWRDPAVLDSILSYNLVTAGRRWGRDRESSSSMLPDLGSPAQNHPMVYVSNPSLPLDRGGVGPTPPHGRCAGLGFATRGCFCCRVVVVVVVAVAACRCSRTRQPKRQQQK